MMWASKDVPSTTMSKSKKSSGFEVKLCSSCSDGQHDPETTSSKPFNSKAEPSTVLVLVDTPIDPSQSKKKGYA